MLLIGVDYHPSFQQIAFFKEEKGECGERQLHHSDGEAEQFYRDLQRRGIRVRVGMEATGYSRWKQWKALAPQQSLFRPACSSPPARPFHLPRSSAFAGRSPGFFPVWPAPSV